VVHFGIKDKFVKFLGHPGCFIPGVDPRKNKITLKRPPDKRPQVKRPQGVQNDRKDKIV
jgi:hypothetical protein